MIDREFAAGALIAIALAALAGAAILFVGWNRRRRRRAFETAALALCRSPDLQPAAGEQITEMRSRIEPLPHDLAKRLAGLYRHEVRTALFDRRLDPPEEHRLDALAGAFGLSAEARAKAELEAFAAIYSGTTTGSPRSPLRTDTIILGRISKMRTHLTPLPDDITIKLEEIYRREILDVLDDKELDDAERTQLDNLAKALGLSDQATSTAELQAFLSLYSEAVADERLTKSEDTALSRLQQRLRFDPALIQEQGAHIARLRAERQALAEQQRLARQVMSSPLVAIETPVQLQRRERCHYECDAVELKNRIVESYSLGGVRYTEKDLVEERSGKLLVTDKRILLVGEGAASYPLKKILDVKVVSSASAVMLVIDGRKSGVYLQVEQPLVLAAYVRRARGAPQDDAT